MRPHRSARFRAGLALLAAACLAPVAAASGAPALRHIEVLVEVPPSNFVFRQGSTVGYGEQLQPGGGSGGLPYVHSPGVSPGAALVVNLLANVIIAAAEKAALESALQAARPVGASVQDLDLRATTFEQLRGLLPEHGPRWHFSTEAFPQPAPVSTEEFKDPVSGRLKRAMPPPPNQHLIDRARASAHEAALFIRVLPLYNGLQDRMYVNVAALLIDRSGATRGEWNTQVMGPGSPRLENAELVQWWAEGRYRRFMLQGIRGGLLPLVEEVSDPALRAQRERLYRALSGVSFDEAGRPVDRLLPHQINVHRKASAACVIQADSADVIYHFDRTHLPNQLLAAAYCTEDKPADWSQEIVPGVAWTQQVRSVPAVVLRRPRP
jgi:hypothetical protein